MDKRWKALTAPLWAELAYAKSTWGFGWEELLEMGWTPRFSPEEYVKRYYLLKLLEIRRARLAGECPVMWKLSQP